MNNTGMVNEEDKLMETEKCTCKNACSGRRVHLGEGIAVCEEQLRAVKWSDYRKLTRGLAAILFSPTELATCSVTGQRWSRAGTATERPVKPALDKAKVQAIICIEARLASGGQTSLGKLGPGHARAGPFKPVWKARASPEGGESSLHVTLWGGRDSSFGLGSPKGHPRGDPSREVPTDALPPVYNGENRG
ncbi:hypothetical protein WN48_03140 [Eufriesea mexicana]|nr:hypothetical protein WN48_03140 [Eufriesea mexicana]